jgi:4-hydroxybenzoate polyprenyltransferase
VTDKEAAGALFNGHEPTRWSPPVVFGQQKVKMSKALFVVALLGLVALACAAEVSQLAPLLHPLVTLLFWALSASNSRAPLPVTETVSQLTVSVVAFCCFDRQ